MREFFVPKDLLLLSNSMGMNSDFSVRGFSGGISEAIAMLSINVKPKQAEFIGLATGGATNGAAFNITMPPEVLPGDIVVVTQSLMWSSDRVVGPTTSGYTQVADLYASDTRHMNLSVHYKIMGDPVDESVALTASGAGSYPTCAALHVWRGIDVVNPMDVTRTTAVGINSGKPNPPAILPQTQGAIILVCSGGMSTNCWGYLDNPEYENVAYRCADSGNAIDIIMASALWDGVSTYNTTHPRPVNSEEENSEITRSWASCALALRPAL